jgi:hypothetical protein
VNVKSALKGKTKAQHMQPDPKFVGVTKEGKVVDSLPVLDEVAYDPTQMTVDLTKSEKRRTTALMLAIQAYEKLIIKDAEMYEAISRDRERKNGPVIQPATINAMVEAAMDFDDFIAGRFDEIGTTKQIYDDPPSVNHEPEEATEVTTNA